jgi:hypothetical protein
MSQVAEWSLNRFKDMIKAKLDQFVAFWSVMDDIDKNTWVVDPLKPTLRDTKRVIALSE